LALVVAADDDLVVSPGEDLTEPADIGAGLYLIDAIFGGAHFAV